MSTTKKRLASVERLTTLAHAIIEILVYRKGIIVVFGSIHPILGDVQVHAIIPRFRNSHSVVFKRLIAKSTQLARQLSGRQWAYLKPSLLLGAIIHAPSNDVPSTIHIRDVPPP
jgi:hypothetical protein